MRANIAIDTHQCNAKDRQVLKAILLACFGAKDSALERRERKLLVLLGEQAAHAQLSDVGTGHLIRPATVQVVRLHQEDGVPVR